MAHSEKALTPRQGRFVAELLAGQSAAAAAEVAGVSLRTAWRWLARPDVGAELRRRSRRLLDQCEQRLHAASADAAKLLADVVRNDEMPSTTRVRAALGLIDVARRVALDELEARVGALEAQRMHEP